LHWELHRLWARPRTYLGFALTLVFELALSTLLRVTSVRERIAHDLWKMHAHWQDVFSGLTTGVHLMGETMTVFGSLSLALVAGDIVAKEAEEGTLRLVFARPVSRARVFGQKLLVCLAFAVVLTAFIAASALGVGLLFEGRGPLLMVAAHEGVYGLFDFAEGLRRYALASGLMWFTAVSGLLWAFLFSCSGVRPATAAVAALTIFVCDDLIRTQPGLATVSPYCLTTRMLSWRQVFCEEIPWPRIERNYTQLAEIDLGLVAVAWLLFRRREF
jgi:ABC-2 type transport system permease protein